MFIPITKVDATKREVWGRAIDEAPDKVGEVFDYVTSKPYFKAWSEDCQKVTDGKSLGTLRSMHKLVAAGKVIDLQFDDAAKAVDIGTRIVDDQEWDKVLEGVYTGFSAGGGYVKKWQDSGKTRYTMNPNEISLVDRPMVPTARFQVIKADGVVEERAFKAASDKAEPAGEVTKGLYTVGELARLLDQLAYIQRDTLYEANAEGDKSPIPNELKEACAGLAAILRGMVAEETAELTAAQTPTGEEAIAMAEKTDDAQKAGARHSKDDATRVQAIHDQARDLGADCGGGEGGEKAEKAEVSAAKAATTEEALAKTLTAAVEQAVGERLAKVEAALETIAPAVLTLLNQPAPAKGALKSVEKAQDITPSESAKAAVEAGGDAKKSEAPTTTTIELIKAAQRHPLARI